MKYTPVPNDTPKVEQDYYHLEKYDSDCPICGIRSFSHLHRVGTLPKDLERVYEEGKDYDTFEAKDTPTYSARVTHKHEWHCPKCEFGCYSDKESEQMSPLIKEHQNSHKDTPKETWEEELLGFNSNGIVSYSDGLAISGYKTPFAICNNCGMKVEGEKAKEWMFGHKDCSKSNGEYIRNDVTPEKLRRVISKELELARREGVKDFLCNLMTYINIIKPESSAFIKKVDKVLNEYLATLREKEGGK